VSHHPAGRSAWPLPRRRRSVIPRRLVASGSGLLAQRCLVGIEPPLELAPFGLWPDLDEHHHDDTGPQRPAERVEQVGHQQQRLRRRRGFEQEPADMSDQAPSRSRSRGSSTRAAARKPAPETRAGAAPSRPRREDRRRRCLALGPRQSTGVDHPSLPILRSWSTSCQPLRVPASLRPGRPACCPHQTDGSRATTLALLLAPSAGHAREKCVHWPVRQCRRQASRCGRARRRGSAPRTAAGPPRPSPHRRRPVDRGPAVAPSVAPGGPGNDESAADDAPATLLTCWYVGVEVRGFAPLASSARVIGGPPLAPSSSSRGLRSG